MIENPQTESEQPRKLPRPVLLISRQNTDTYAPVLKRLLLGFAENSITPLIVTEPNCPAAPFAMQSIQPIQHPLINIPFILKRKNYDILLDKISKFKPNIIHCFSPDKIKLARKIAKSTNLKYILSLQNLNKHLCTPTVLSKTCAKILLPTTSMVENFKRLHPKLAPKTQPVNIGTFAQPQIKCLNNTNHAVTISTYIESDHSEKITNLLNAIRHLAIDGYEFMLVIIAGKKAEANLRKTIRELGLTQSITIIPKDCHCNEILLGSDIFIQPTPCRSFNTMLLEAMACGLAVASCKTKDDLVIKDQTAILFDPADELDVYASIQKLLDNRDFTRQLAQNCLDQVKNNYMVSDMIQSTIDIYNLTINQ